MTFLEELLLALGLAMDAFSVSIYKGVKEGKINIPLCITLGLTFGLMQGLMPLIGYFLTSIPLLEKVIQDYSKYIIFVLLMFIGGKMLIDAIKEFFDKDNEEEKEQIKEENKDNQAIQKRKGLPFSKEIFVLGIATSIDALSIGITFTGYAMNILQVLVAVSVIACVTFVFSFLGCMFGKVLSKYIKNYAGIFGGLVLIFIGIKVLLGF
ncbi:MAG: manganese efflux pump [Clostridia bacterium]|nr:manganese efflux pump [Clostridia bacterium]